jgi:hypothetical protein
MRIVTIARGGARRHRALDLREILVCQDEFERS